MKRIMILGTGGTIAGKSPDQTDIAGYRSGAAGLQELLQALPVLDTIAAIETEDLFAIGSEDMSPFLWQKMALRVQQLAEDSDIDGIVVTHGTDTMEETAYFLHLVLQTEKPVVLVGAMRPATALSADGPMNLYKAVLVAAAPEAAGKGVLLVMNDTIFSARYLQKQDSFRLGAFTGGSFGVVGHVVNSNVMLLQQPMKKHTLATVFDSKELCTMTDLPRVELVTLYPGADPHLLNAVKGLGARGLVVAAYGNGTMSQEMNDALSKLAAEGMLIAIASRCYHSMVAQVNPSFIAALDLSPAKARVLLMLALTQTNDPEQIQELFLQY